MDLDRDERLADLEARVARLEGQLVRVFEGSASLEGDQGFLSQPEAMPSRGAEYWIGAKLLPRFGAVLIILAIAFVAISESSKNPSLDRMLLLGGEALFCLAFIAFGEWRRNEMEGFGPTLSAIGSVGLYLTAAGGHFAYHQLSAAGMAGVFAALTLINHGFAVWRSTRLFFVIGATGGLAAMLYPLAEKDYATALAVYVAVTVAGALACARKGWSQLALLGWFLSLLIIIPVIDSDHPRVFVLASMYAGSLACIAAYTHTRSKPTDDTWGIGAPVGLFLTGVMGFWVQHDPAGLLHLLVLGLAGFGIAAALSQSRACRNALQVGSLATVAVLGPLCFSPVVATFAYATFAVAASAVGRSAFHRLAAVFAVMAVLAAGLGYVGCAARVAGAVEAALLASLAVALGSATLALRRAGWDWIGLAVGGTWILLVRAAVAISPDQGNGLASHSNLTVATLAYALLLLALGFRLESAALRMWSFAVMMGSVVQILFLDAGTAVGFRIASLVAVGVLMLVGGYRYVHDQRSSNSPEVGEQEVRA